MGFLFNFFVIIPLVVALIAVLLSVVEQNQYVSLPKPDYLGSIRDRPPADSKEFGRYTKPLSTIDYSWVSSSKTFNFIALKHWDYKSVSSSRYFIVAAIANLNYVANAFVYVVDRTDRQKAVYQYPGRSVLARSIGEQAKSSIDGCTHFNQSSSEFILLCYNPQAQRYEMKANVPVTGGLQVSFDLQIEYSTKTDESMVLLYPVTNARPAYTHKVAALPAHGTLEISNQQKELIRDGLSSIDWTLAYSERLSRWKWASLSTVGTNSSSQESVDIGINLSDLVYNDNAGVSMEGAVWITGKVYATHHVVFQLPETQLQTTDEWHLSSVGDTNANTPKLQLTFQPWGSQEEHTNALLVAGDFVQVFGVFSGTIEFAGHQLVIENGFGVTENHYAKW